MNSTCSSQVKSLLSIGCVAILFAGCTPSAPTAHDSVPQEEQKIIVATSFYPLTHFAEQVGGNLIEVQQVASPGADPHSYEPTPSQMQQIFESDLLIYNGAGQDPYADRIYEELKQKGTRVLIATELVKRMSYEHEEHDEHGHEEHEEEHHNDHDDHEHGEWDPHVWLDPLRAAEIVQAIATELSAIDPTLESQFQANADAYAAKLHTLDADMKAGLLNCNLDAIVVSHDAYRYLADRYGFHTLEIAGLSPSAKPSPARLAELTEIAQEEGIAHVFFETHVSPALSETLAAEIGAETLVLHSIEALTKQERLDGMTYISIQRKNLEHLRTALECS